MSHILDLKISVLGKQFFNMEKLLSTKADVGGEFSSMRYTDGEIFCLSIFTISEMSLFCIFFYVLVDSTSVFPKSSSWIN